MFVNETPFYATSGGQEADTGYIRTAEGEFKVEDTVKLLGGKIGHIGVMTKGMIKVGDKVSLEVDAKKRALSARNHSATHLLQKALRTVLGTHVEQAGSSVNEDRLRFDFTHFSAMTAEELKKVEDIVKRTDLQRASGHREEHAHRGGEEDRCAGSVWREIWRHRTRSQYE